MTPYSSSWTLLVIRKEKGVTFMRQAQKDGLQHEERMSLHTVPCIICGHPYLHNHPYGRWGNEGTCSKKCEMQQEASRSAPSLTVVAD